MANRQTNYRTQREKIQRARRVAKGTLTASAALVGTGMAIDAMWGNKNPYSNNLPVKHYLKLVESLARHEQGTQEFDDLGAKIKTLESSPEVMMYRGWEGGQQQSFRSLGEVGLYISAFLLTYGIFKLMTATEEPNEQNPAPSSD